MANDDKKKVISELNDLAKEIYTSIGESKEIIEAYKKIKNLSASQLKTTLTQHTKLKVQQENYATLLRKKADLEIKAGKKTKKEKDLAHEEKRNELKRMGNVIKEAKTGLAQLAGKKLNKELSSTTQGLKNMLTAGIALAGMIKVSKKVGAYYDKYIMPIDAANQKIAASFGNLSEGAGKVSFSGMAASTTDMRKEVLALKVGLDGVSGDGGALQFLSPGMKGAEEAIKLMGDTTEKLGTRLDALVKPFDKSRRSVMILQQAIGATDEDTQTFADRSIIMGTTIEVQMATAAKASKKMAKGFGVNAKTLSKNVHLLRKDFAGFATFSEEQLAKTAAAAQKLGISMAGISKLNVFDDFDKTADAAAQLGQSFGINVDAFELFQEQDPAKRLRMLQESAQDAGVDVSQMGRIGLKHFAELTGGMDVDEVLKSFSPGNIMRAQEGLKDAALKPAETLQQQQSSMIMLSSTMAQKGKEFFDQYVDLIPIAISDFKTKTQAITDSFKAGGGLPDTIRKTLAAPLANFFGKFSGQLGDPKNRGAIDKGILEVLEPIGGAITALSGTTDELGKSLRAKSTLEKAVKENKPQKEIIELAKASKAAEMEASKNISAALDKAGTGFINAGDILTSKAVDTLKGVTTALGGDNATNKAGKMASSLAKSITGPLSKELNTFFTDLMPKLMASIKKALGVNDVAINDATIGGTGSLPMLKGPVSSMQLASGMTVHPNPNDALIAGRPGDIVSKYMDIVATAQRQLREVNATAPMQVSGDKLPPQTITVNAGNQPTVIQNNITLEIDGTTIARATLSSPINPGGPTLGDALMNANPLGNDVATA